MKFMDGEQQGKLSLTEKLFNMYAENPALKNKDAAEMLGIPETAQRKYKCLLRQRGFIDTDNEGNVIILREMRAKTGQPLSFKGEIYVEMIDTYMEDFRNQTTFADRLAVGREIRLILEKL